MENRCCICDGRPDRLKVKAKGFSINRCKACGLISAEGVTKEAVDSFYGHRYFSNDGSRMGYRSYADDEKNHRKNAKHILLAVDRIKPLAGTRVLDIGCAFGFLLDEAKKLGVNGLYGLEVAECARKYARDALGLENITAGGTLQNFEAGYFDVVFLIGTIEHLISPEEMMADINRVLKPGGLVVITTVDIKGVLPLYSIKPPEHIFYFSHFNLPLFLKRSGFRQIMNRAYCANYYFHDLVYRLGEFLSVPFVRDVADFFRKNLSFSVRIPTNEMFVIARKADCRTSQAVVV